MISVAPQGLVQDVPNHDPIYGQETVCESKEVNIMSVEKGRDVKCSSFINCMHFV